MFKRLSLAAVALAAANLAGAQTSTKCNPLEKKCPDDPALGGSLFIDFTKGPSDDIELDGGTKITKYDPELGAEFILETENSSATAWMKKYILFGTVSVVCRAAPGTGIVTSIVLQSEALDEIDWEWIGGDNANVQSNYFRHGDDGTYDRGGTHPIGNPQGEFHNYTIDWRPEYMRWYIDGALIREVSYAAAKNGVMFPQTPAKLKLGPWIGGHKDAKEGVVKWAGGYADFSKAPFRAYYKSISITDYQTGAAKYVWPDVPAGGRGEGRWQDIKIIKGDGSEGSGKPGDGGKSDGGKSDGTTSASKTATSAPVSATSSAGDSKTSMTSMTANSTDASSSSVMATTTTAGSSSSTTRAAATTTTGAPNSASGSLLGWHSAALIIAGLVASFFTS